MKASVTLGRPFGITVGAHWSLFVFGLFAVWSLAAGFQSTVPGYAGATYWVTAFAVVALFVAGLVVHELSHALVARRHGLEVERITLWILGGMAELSREPETAKAELRIAAAGPLASAAVAVVLFGLAIAVGLATDAQVLIAGLWWLAVATAIVAIFNLLPARPMDGGRILTAILWARTKDQVRATVSAAKVSSVLGWTMVAFGGWLLLAGGAFAGIWFALIGWMVVAGSRIERRVATWRSMLRGLRFRDVMSAPPPTVSAFSTVRELVADASATPRSPLRLVVGAGGTVVGVLSVADLGRSAFTRPDRLVSELARPIADAAVAEPDEDVGAALAGRIVLLPVLVREAGGRVVGQVGADDLTRWADAMAAGGRPPATPWPGAPLPPPRPQDRVAS